MWPVTLFGPFDGDDRILELGFGHRGAWRAHRVTAACLLCFATFQGSVLPP